MAFLAAMMEMIAALFLLGDTSNPLS